MKSETFVQTIERAFEENQTEEPKTLAEAVSNNLKEETKW